MEEYEGMLGALFSRSNEILIDVKSPGTISAQLSLPSVLITSPTFLKMFCVEVGRKRIVGLAC